MGDAANVGDLVKVDSSELPPEAQRRKHKHLGSVVTGGQYVVRRTGNAWFAGWEAPQELLDRKPPGDYRDSVPPQMSEIVELYSPYVQDGKWTFGLWDMWSKREKVVKSAVHIPCCPSCRMNPFQWRGILFGRTAYECFWTGLDRTRWARTVYAAGLGREFTIPCIATPFGKNDLYHRIRALAVTNYVVGFLATFGFGQLFTVPSNINAAACWDCHSREKLRRKYNLPPAIGCVPGVDDCCVHFWCMYCASHQEMRELAVRGIDGEGMHILDGVPDSFKNVPGIEAAIAERKLVVEAMLAAPVPPHFLSFEERIRQQPGIAARVVKGNFTHGVGHMHAAKAVTSGNGAQQPAALM